MLALALRHVHTFLPPATELDQGSRDSLLSQQSFKIGLVESHSARGHIGRLHNAGTVK
jgi:hypothetical protein